MNKSYRRAAGLSSTALFVTSLFMLHAPAAQAADQQWEQTSPDGLQLSRTLPYGAIYMKPGATFEQYKRLALLDCFVQFAKDWQRNYNQDEPDLEMQVSQGDMNRIKTELAAEFKRVFTQELQTDGGYEIVDIAAPDVLILRPAILNLIVSAGDRHGAANVGLRGRLRRADDALPRAVGFHDEHAPRPRDRHRGGPGTRWPCRGRQFGREQGCGRPHPEELGRPTA